MIDVSNESSYRKIPCTVVPDVVVNDRLYSHNFYEQGEDSFSLTYIDIETGESSLIYELKRPDNYENFTVCGVSESEVTFIAIRLSDGEKVLAKMGLDNEVSIQQESARIIAIVPLE